MTLTIRRITTLILMALFTTGCESLKRLTEGREEPKNTATETWTSNPAKGETPDFGIPTPAGATKVVYHDLMPLDGVVRIQAGVSTVKVFIKVRGDINQWFILKPIQKAEGFWYSFDPANGTVVYHGLNIGGTEYYILQFVEE